MSESSQSLSSWIVQWVELHYPDESEFNRPDARVGCFNDLPRRFMPSLDRLVWLWFMKSFNNSLTKSGFAFPSGSRGKEVVRQYDLPWDEFRELLVGKLVLSRRDQERVKNDLREWAERNVPTLDVDRAFHELLQAAGL